MPLERVSQGFKDISMTFQANPLNDDLIGLKNENAIARSVKNIVFTVNIDLAGDGRWASTRKDPYKYGIDSWKQWCNKWKLK